jgi:hypothetical protein
MIGIRLTNPPNDLVLLFSGIEKEFYFSYSEFVLSELSKDNVQSFLNMVIRKEKVDLSKVADIRIMRFPFGTSQAEIEYADRKKIKLEGGTYFGHYIPELKRIDIYPPRFNNELIKNTSAKQFYDNEEIRCFWFFYQPLKTLVHELLHIKYKEHEGTVERLSQKYMNLL